MRLTRAALGLALVLASLPTGLAAAEPAPTPSPAAAPAAPQAKKSLELRVVDATTQQPLPEGVVELEAVAAAGRAGEGDAFVFARGFVIGGARVVADDHRDGVAVAFAVGRRRVGINRVAVGLDVRADADEHFVLAGEQAEDARVVWLARIDAGRDALHRLSVEVNQADLEIKIKGRDVGVGEIRAGESVDDDWFGAADCEQQKKRDERPRAHASERIEVKPRAAMEILRRRPAVGLIRGRLRNARFGK